MKIVMHADKWGTLDGVEYFQMKAGDRYEASDECGAVLVAEGVAMDVENPAEVKAPPEAAPAPTPKPALTLPPVAATKPILPPPAAPPAD